MKWTVAGALVLAGCGASSSTPSAPATEAAASSAAPVASAAPVSKGIEPPSVDEVWGRVRADLTACYEIGHKAIPTMTDAHIAYVASVEAGGQTTCVVPSEDSGLTQEVEDCMRARLEKESYGPARRGWSIRLPVLVKGSAVTLGGAAVQTAIATIETRGLSEDVYDVIDGINGEMKACVSEAGTAPGRRVVTIGARVGKDGAVACAVASSSSPVPWTARKCLMDVFGHTKFKAPKRGVGLLSIPIEITK